MRIAFFSPLPPARSGIADYSDTLLESLRPLAHVETFSSASQPFDPARFDVALYQIGNNGFHDFVYETALRHPGVTVLHESNLHHLITELTIKRGDWDAYVAECEYNGGAEARAFAERVRKLEIGPDYEGVNMTRRLLEASRGVIVHSRFVRDEVFAAGYHGPVGVIPHGAWIPPSERQAYRSKLGLDERAPLVGIFGFLKPYKRIAESLRAFRRVVRLVPNAKMILVGEPHAELPVESMIRSLGLTANVRVIGFAPLADFVGYLSACDVVLNLRFPTVGESSGTLLRSLGLGKAVIVSEVGSFAEYPDDACLKVPPGPGEEDLLFEYLNLLISRPDVARALGDRAREYVARECNWPAVARQYVAFLESVIANRAYEPPKTAAESAPETAGPPEPIEEAPVPIENLAGWAENTAAKGYLETHRTRLVKTLAMTPPGDPDARILEMGAYMQMTPALQSKLGYGYVRGCYYGPRGRIDHRTAPSHDGQVFECDIDPVDAAKDPVPDANESFDTVLCCELIEHLFNDPMHLMSEINRILKPGGHVLLTTPNVAALRGISAILQGYHPGFFHAYIKPSESGEVDARHNREYTPREMHMLLENCGFSVEKLETGEFLDEPHPEFGWVHHLLAQYRLDTELRGDGIYALGRKTGPIKERYPGWLYS